MLTLERFYDIAAAGDHWGQEPASSTLRLARSEISLADREARIGQRGATVLLTGLTGSGKATIAYPLPMAALVRSLAALPRFVYEPLAARSRRS